MRVRYGIFCCLLLLSLNMYAHPQLERLKKAYPENIRTVSTNYITWQDGKRMLVRSSLPFLDALVAKLDNIDLSLGSISTKDVENDTYEPFFKKMYGHSAKEVQKNLVTIYWMSHLYGKRYPLRVTRINQIDKKLLRISDALEKLPLQFHKYVIKPASSYYWRNVAKEKYLSLHSFGIAIDINLDYSNYWLWDYQRLKTKGIKPAFRNRIPEEIVAIFEKEGFAWGGHWYHYDTMHFEYRPELFL